MSEQIRKLPDRIIGSYTGYEKGSLLIALGGMHGNEPAGVEALSRMFDMLEVEPLHNPEFRFKGRFVGLRGNLQALAKGVRYIEKDLNRIWTTDFINQLKSTPIQLLQNEDLELRQLIDLIEMEIATYQPHTLVLLDLHTTTANGGIFSIPAPDPDSLDVAVELHAPVITGLLDGLDGTILHYFRKDNLGVNILGVSFESGQHEDHLSVNRAIAAITNCMRTIGCVQPDHVENRHDELLINYSRSLPKVAELITVHQIKPGDEFQMAPNYKNFQKVKKGERLASDRNGDILAQDEGLILMPLYQSKGDDGFFLIRSLAY